MLVIFLYYNACISGNSSFSVCNVLMRLRYNTTEHLRGIVHAQKSYIMCASDLLQPGKTL